MPSSRMGFFSRRRQGQPIKTVGDTPGVVADSAPSSWEPEIAYAYNKQPDGFRLPAQLGLQSDVEAALRRRAWGIVVAGNHDGGDYFTELAEDEFGLSEETAKTVWDATVSARRAQQTEWPVDEATTSLSRAFSDLADIGVIARENFSCCGTCAPGEIHDERDGSRVWRGYVYYHMQDTEGLIESGGTYIGYGAFLDAWVPEEEWASLSTDAKDRRYSDIVVGLMDEVVAVFERHGIEVAWNRELQERIYLANVDYYVAI